MTARKRTTKADFQRQFFELLMATLEDFIALPKSKQRQALKNFRLQLAAAIVDGGRTKKSDASR